MLYIMGAGGLGRETYDAALSRRDRMMQFIFVDESKAGQRIRGLDVISPEDIAAGGDFVVGIANPTARKRLVHELLRAGLTPRSILHLDASVGPETSVEEGSVILANTYVSSNVQVGAHVHINYNATVGHDVVIEDFVTVLPGANISGSVLLAHSTTVGAGAVVLPGLSIGPGATIGAGAVVTKDVAAGAVVKGVPARP